MAVLAEMDAEEFEGQITFLGRVARSTDPFVREAAELGRRRLIVKYGFDPSQPRDVAGQWTTEGSGDSGTRTTITPSTADRERQARDNAEARAAASIADQKDRAAADAAVRAAEPKAPKGATAAAVKAAKAKYGIPSPSKLKRLPAAQQSAAAEILDATRDLVRLRDRQAKLQARAAAITKELQDHTHRPKTLARLRQRLDTTRDNLAAVAKDMDDAQARLNAGRRKWAGK